uniref:Uncharacterized protein n=1 Tax=uncultured microorganism TaxID=358574 RepID=I2FJI8_9ZZZZ|nr:hypothetical protein [uncultured microorganism]
MVRYPSAVTESFRLRTFLNRCDVYAILRCVALDWIFKLNDMPFNFIKHTGQKGQKSLLRGIVRPHGKDAPRLEECSKTFESLFRIKICVGRVKQGIRGVVNIKKNGIK